MPRSSQSRPQCAQIADHLAQNTPNSLNFTEVVCTLGASIPNTANMETAARPTGIATASVGGGAWPDIGNDAPIRIIHHNPTGVEGAGGTGGPGRASRRGAERSEVAQPRGRPDPPAPGTPAGPSCASCGRRQGLAGQRADAPNHTSTTCPTGMEGTGGTGGHGQPDPTAPGIPAGPSCGARGRRSPAGQRADAPGHAQRYSAAGVEGAGGTGWTDCGARGRRSPAGQRADAPSEARGADGEWAGRSASITTTPPVWRAPEGPEGQGGLRGAAPNEVRSPSLAGGRALRRPEHQRHHKRLRLARNALAARLAQGQAAVAVDGRTHVDEARARQERRVGAGTELADGVQAFGGEASAELGHEVGH